MHQQQLHSKPPRGNKTHTKSVNTVTLGLQFNEFSERNTDLSKNNTYTYPAATYALSSVFGGGNHNLTKPHVQKKKDSAPTLNKSYGFAPFNSQIKSISQDGLPNTSYVSPYSLTITPLDGISEGQNRKNKGEMMQSNTKQLKPQPYLSGDRTLVAESPLASGVPIIYRLNEDRDSNPDKLNLDRRQLQICPLLEGEENLRLLNLQHNLIRKIQHLSILKKLIFLDLYDNELEEISGVSTLKALRVLMLGKNRIQKIENLQELEILDVLDLHGNKISVIENLTHLRHLRVLNLAGNNITVVKNLAGLESLAELNLRRNHIHAMRELDQLESLQRLFLSFNKINDFDSVKCLSRCKSLVELSMDGNPIADTENYKELVLKHVSSLKQFDMKKINEEDKRAAIAIIRKEEERKKEHDQLTSIRKKREMAIKNAEKQWRRQAKDTLELSAIASNDNIVPDDCKKITSPTSQVCVSPLLAQKSSTKLRVDIKDFSSSHLAELEGDTLHFYGRGSLNAIDKCWDEKSLNSITTLHFNFLNFQDIVPVLSKLNTRFENLTTLKFDTTNITSLNDLNAFSYLQQLDHLYLTPDGNPVTKLPLWRAYLIFRLTDLKLKTLNKIEITHEDILNAERMFGSISHIATSKLSRIRLSMLHAQSQQYDPSKFSSKTTKEENRRSADDMSKAGLIYPRSSSQQQKDNADRNEFSSNYIREIFQAAIMGDLNQKALDNALPKVFSDLIVKYFNEISNYDKYCEESLEKIKKSVNCTL